MKNSRNHLFFIFLIFGILLLSACSGGGDKEKESGKEKDNKGNEEVKEGGDLVIAVLSDAAKMDPQTATDVPTAAVMVNMMEGLVKKDKEDQIIPSLATSWTTIDDVTWEFELQKDVKFHDGEPFNGEAVKANFERILDPEVAAPRAFLFEVIKEVKVIDDHKIQIITEYPFAPLLAHLTHPVGSIISPKSIEEDYAAMENGDEPGSVVNEHLVGTGYFTFGHWNHGTEIKVLKNEDYWGDKVNLKSFTEQLPLLQPY